MENRLLSDDSYFEELELVENELIDQYVQDSVSADERAKLEKRLLGNPRQRQKLAFARALDAESEVRGAEKANVVILPSRRKKTLWDPSYYKIAAMLIAVVGLSIVLWIVLGRKSDVERGMIALNDAQGDERLVQSRISELKYAPVKTLRGPQQGLANRQARDYSERLLLDAVRARNDAASYHALGRLYLAERNFTKAREQFQQALAKDPNDAQLQSDMGAALIELGESNAGERLRLHAEALQYLNRALELNPSLPEALFNRALIYQYMKLPEAKDAWRKYLEVDSTSPWAREAERNLKLLEEQEKNAQERRTLLYSSFLAAYHENNPAAAWIALKQSRSRSGNYVVEKLVDDFLALSIAGKQEEAAEAGEQLAFAGDTEKQHARDRYTSDLAAFYRRLSSAKHVELARARQLMNSGRERYDASEFEPAAALFTEAQKVFAAAGDEAEALFAENWISYTDLRSLTPGTRERLERLVETYSNRHYASLMAQSIHAISDAWTQKNEFSRVLEEAGRALKLASDIEDDSTRLRCLQQFVSINLILGNYAEAFSYAMTALEMAPQFITEPKLIWTFYQEIAKAFCWLNLSAAAMEFQREALRLADLAQWPFSIARSYTQLGILHERKSEFQPAIQAAQHAVEEGQKIKDDRSRLAAVSHAYLRLGHIYRDAGDYSSALLNYDQAMMMFDQIGSVAFLYEAHKGKFISYLSLNDIAAAKNELDRALTMFEEYRVKIHEERNRNVFFDAGQDIYDLAIDFALAKLNDKQKAFNYAEDSRARALFDLISTTPQLINKGEGPDIKMQPALQPQTFTSLRQEVPAGVTILEYAVLNDKLVIWVLTRDKLDVETKSISATDLQQQITAYVKSLASGGDALKEKTAAVDLYRVLIEPVEKYISSGDELCIVPDKTLFLPFAALVSPDTGKFLIEKYRVVVSPSANVFMACTRDALRKERMTGSESVLSVGNPSFSREAHRDLADLPSAAREAAQVAVAYRSEALLGPRANERQVRARMAQSDVIHFAAHYVIDQKSPMMSELLLSQPASSSGVSHEDDGLLQAYEIYTMKLRRTRLAVLSACQTGLERSYQGEGAVGMARSFIAAGVPLVVASLWPVDSDTTASLMIKFHEYRKVQGLSTAEALQRAQIEMVASGEERLRNPNAWAAFVVVGGHASF
ncbi:MAG TPA: CHAT domain-containing protein [Pyrinomonadaceae bacterium]|nr:CHAT domain-containing protein [Pyrinomonadaceae bacterium]